MVPAHPEVGVLVTTKRKFPGPLFMLQGSALADIWPWLVATAVVASILTALYGLYDFSWFEPTTTPFTLVGLALSIFLGFRNNACYERWWEGRKLWGQLVNSSRSYARQILTLIDAREPEATEMQRRAVHRMAAYAHALRMHLRDQPRWEELAPLLPEGGVEALRPERNKPIALLHQMAVEHRQAMDRGWLDRFHLPILEETLTALANLQGGCERIKNAPVPLSYTELTHRVVALYVLFLPFGVVHQVGFLTPVVVVFVAFCFLGLDAVGTQIENPFEEDPNDLPLLQLSRLIENDLRQRLGESVLPPDIEPDGALLL